MSSNYKFFSIKTKTVCALKRNWSRVYLNIGYTASCHRTAFSKITPENFLDSHNTPTKLAVTPCTTKENIEAYEYMKGILVQICESPKDLDKMANLIIYLDEKDRRQGTNWPELFPWLTKYRKYVV